MGLAHEKKSYLQEKANLFEIASKKQKFANFPLDKNGIRYYNLAMNRFRNIYRRQE